VRFSIASVRISAWWIGVLTTGWICLLPHPVRSSPRIERPFTIDVADMQFVLPISIHRPARLQIHIEWYTVYPLRAVLIPPRMRQPIRRAFARAPIDWEVTTDEVPVYRGFWKLILRSPRPDYSYRGEVIIFIDYTYTPEQQEILSEPERAEPLPAAPKWGLMLIEIVPDLSEQTFRFRTVARFPRDADSEQIRSVRLQMLYAPADRPQKGIQLRAPEYQDHTVIWVSDPVRLRLGDVCIDVRLQSTHPFPDTWRSELSRCFRVQCRPKVRVQETELPEPLRTFGITSVQWVVEDRQDRARLRVRWRFRNGTVSVPQEMDVQGPDGWTASIQLTGTAGTWEQTDLPLYLGTTCLEWTLPERTPISTCFRVDCPGVLRIEPIFP